MSKVQIWNSLNARERKVKGETFTLPSKTIPDQTLSIQEIMRRYAAGLPLEGEKVPFYDGEEEDLPDVRKMDLAEVQEMREAIADNIQASQQKLRKWKQQQLPIDKPQTKDDDKKDKDSPKGEQSKSGN